MSARVSQEGLNVIFTTNPKLQIVQDGLAVIYNGTPKGQVAQDGLAVVYNSIPKGRLAQAGLLVIAQRITFVYNQTFTDTLTVAPTILLENHVAADYSSGVTQITIVGDVQIGNEIYLESDSTHYVIIDKNGQLITLDKPVNSNSLKGRKIFKVTNVAQSFTLDLGDSGSGTKTLNKTYSESINITYSTLLSRPARLSDTLIFNENIVSIRVQSQNYLDSLSIIDTLTNNTVKNPNLSDSLSLNDSSVNNIIRSLNYSDSLSIVDTLTNNINVNLSYSDSLTLNDTLVNLSNLVFDITDSLILNDSITNFHSLVFNINDSLTLNDSLLNYHTFSFNLNDTLDLTETELKSLTKTLNDSLNLIDSCFYELSNGQGGFFMSLFVIGR